MDPYLFDESLVVSSPAFVFEGWPGVGADLLGIAERLLFGAQDSTVGKIE